MESVMHRTSPFFTACFVLFGLTLSVDADAQFKKLFDSTKKAAEREITKTVEDSVSGAVTCAIDDEKCVEDAKNSGDEVVIVNADGEVIEDVEGNPISDPSEAKASAEQPGEGVWRNYDFSPGTRVKFASDWSDARVGRIPRDIKFIKGNMEIVDLNGERVLEFRSASIFQVVLDEPLPEGFSVEFDAKTAATNQFIRVYGEAFSEAGTATSRYEHHYLNVWKRAGIDFQGNAVSGATSKVLSDTLHPVKFQVDEGYAIMYVDTDRVAQVPNASFPSSSIIEFSVTANDNLPAYLNNIIIAYDVDDPYGSLMADRQFTTRGIFFDVNKDRLRPESTPVLERLLDMLESHPELDKITIEGHTDSSGDDAYNQELSARRAASVKAYFVGKGIDASRMETAGLGETAPVADNSTEAGRQENRRVVIRLPDTA